MKRKGCLVFTKIGWILLITKGGSIPLPAALPSLGVILELQGIL